MNAQVIHQTQAPEVIDWLKEVESSDERRAEALHSLAHDLSAEYGEAHGGHRSLVVRHWLVGGFAPVEDEEGAPTGWVRSDEWGGFIPDTATEIGRRWQARIDDLPAVRDELHSAHIGMPDYVEAQTTDGQARRFYPTFHFNPEKDTVFATWPERWLLAPLTHALQQFDNAVSLAWAEMPRSDWYKYVESLEAQAELDQILGR